MAPKGNHMLKSLVIFLALIMTAGVAAGCKGGGSANKTGGTQPVTVTIWDTQSGQYGSIQYAKAGYKTEEDTPYNQAWAKAANVKIQYVDSTGGADKLNLLFASNTQPDIVLQNWLAYPGGPTAAINNKIIMPLNDIINKYAPNYKKYLASDPEVNKELKTDDGKYYDFANITGKDCGTVYRGLALRTDWLTDLGLQSPKTIDDWTNVLKAFKSKETGGAAPLYGDALDYFEYAYGVFGAGMVGNGSGTTATGVTDGFYVQDGKVKYAPIEPGYKDWLTTMNSWLQAGLIDQDAFTAKDSNAMWAKLSANKIGTVKIWTGSGFTKVMTLAKSNSGLSNLTPVAFPTLKAGDTLPVDTRNDRYAYTNSTDAAISTTCKHPDAAARLLDYNYSEAGRMLDNFGIEGKSYTMVNGQPKLTAEITSNSSGLSFNEAMQIYAGPTKPGVLDKRYQDQYYSTSVQQQSLKVWTSSGPIKQLPAVTMTPAESTAIVSKLNDINTYVSQTKAKFVLGQQPLSGYDAFVAQVNKMGIADVLKIYQAAYQRYSNRK